MKWFKVIFSASHLFWKIHFKRNHQHILHFMYASLLFYFSILFLVSNYKCMSEYIAYFFPNTEIKTKMKLRVFFSILKYFIAYILQFSVCFFFRTQSYLRNVNHRWKVQYHDRRTDNTWRTAGTCSGRRLALCSRRHKPRVLSRVPRTLEYASPRQWYRYRTCYGPILWSQNRSQRPLEPGKERSEQPSGEWTRRPNQPLFTQVPAVFRKWSTITETADKRLLDTAPNSFQVVKSNDISVFHCISLCHIVGCAIFLSSMP